MSRPYTAPKSEESLEYTQDEQCAQDSQMIAILFLGYGHHTMTH